MTFSQTVTFFPSNQKRTKLTSRPQSPESSWHKFVITRVVSRLNGRQRDLPVGIDPPMNPPGHHQPHPPSPPRAHVCVQLECATSCWECLRNLRHNRMRYVAAFRAHRESPVRYLCIQARGGYRIHVRIR